MKSVLGLTAAFLVAAALASSFPSNPAHAYECKARLAATSGVAMRPGSPPPRLRKPACRRASGKWEELARQSHGPQFADWAASDSRRERFWFTATHGRCQVSAKPCTPLE